MISIKKCEGVKEYGSRLMSIVNQIKLLRGDFPSHRVVDKLLVILPSKYETKISSLEDSKDLSTLSFVELINALHAVDQRIKMRVEYEENKGEEAFFVKNSSYKGKVSCNYCKKIGHEENNC